MGTTNDNWQELTTAALLGTGRQEMGPINADAEVGELLNQLDRGDREGALLGTAAALSLYLRAGYRPKTDARPVPQASEPEDLPRCGPQVSARLALMLEGEYRDVLPECLRALATAGRRAPEERLPALLSLGLTASEEVKDLIPGILGRRGLWLAAQNSDWQYAIECEEDNVWQTGKREQRLAFLRKLRSTDPKRTLELLDATWNEETPEDRAAFVESLSIGLSPADESFLEQRLDDRRKEVRKTAASLLARLPDSALSRRMKERLSASLILKKGFLGKHSLIVQPPAVCDEQMIRDGIDAKPPSGFLGEKAFWLSQMIGAVAPDHWLRQSGQTPADLIRLARQSEWSEPLLIGWRHAAIAHRNGEWAEALLRWWFSEDDKKGMERVEPLTAAPALTPAQWESLVLDLLRNYSLPLYEAHPAMPLLQNSKTAWSPALARAVIKSIRARIKIGEANTPIAWTVRALLKPAAVRVPPELLDEFSKDWPAASPWWPAFEQQVDEFLATVQFRGGLLAEIAAEQTNQTG
jgi:hypothetical protein